MEWRVFRGIVAGAVPGTNSGAEGVCSPTAPAGLDITAGISSGAGLGMQVEDAHHQRPERGCFAKDVGLDP